MNAMSPATITMRPIAVDLVCGGGRRSDLWRDRHIDPTCKHPFEENVKANYHEYDVFELTSDFVASLFTGGHTRVLADCAPWRPFSAYTRGSSGRMRQWQLLDFVSTT